MADLGLQGNLFTPQQLQGRNWRLGPHMSSANTKNLQYTTCGTQSHVVLSAVWDKEQNQPKSSRQGVWSERETSLDQEFEHKVESNKSGQSGGKTAEEFILNTQRSNQGRLSGGGGLGSVPWREENQKSGLRGEEWRGKASQDWGTVEAKGHWLPTCCFLFPSPYTF